MNGKKMTFAFVFFLLILVWIPFGSTLSCARCRPKECLPYEPKCCDSGYITKDVCGCCKQCASPAYGKCGGNWNLDGDCAPGLRCVRVCRNLNSGYCQTAPGTCVYSKWIKTFQFVLKTVKAGHHVDEEVQLRPIKRCKSGGVTIN